MFIMTASLGAVGVFLGIKTRVPGNKNELLYGVALYAKYGGWILGIGSTLVALRLLSRLVSS